MEWIHSNNTRQSFKFSQSLLPLMVTLILAGCDGGSGTVQSRTLSFTNNDNAKLLIDEQYPNPASTVGGGIIQYESDDEDIAKVDNQGKVTALKPGRTKIRARIDASGNFTSASANYSVDVIKPEANLTAWIGTDNTEIQLPKGMAGIDFYTSSDPNCDYDNFAKCSDDSDLVTDLADGAVVTDKGALKLGEPGLVHYQVRYGKRQAEGAISTARFSPRALHQAVFFKNRFWVIGGQDGSQDDEVWSSDDGLSWLQVEPDDSSPMFTPREGHQLVVFDAGDDQGEQLWILGGEKKDGGVFTHITNEVWSSTDGVSWTAHHLNNNDLYTECELHQAVVFNGALWIFGGAGNNDVWFSSDGVEWDKKDDSNFPVRQKHQVVEFDNRLWLVDGSDRLGDVWMSEDGETWTDVTAETEAGFPGRSEHQVVVFDNTLWLMGGFDGSRRLNDVWAMHKTGEGTYQWQKRSNDSNFDEVAPTGIVFFQTLVADGQLWLIGGNKGKLSNEVWSSSDGLTWTPSTNQAQFSARKHHQVVVFDDDPDDNQPARLWLIGGTTGTFSDEIWSSRDGLNWKLEPAGERFSARAGHKVAVFDDQLWLVGGRDSSGRQHDVWSSADGLVWQNKTEATTGVDRFEAREAHQLVTFNNKLWLLAGLGQSGSLKDVWSLSSASGSTWQERSETLPTDFPSRQFHQAVVFNNELLLIAGSNQNDVWALSIDETLWVQKTGGQRFTPRGGHQVVVYNDGAGEKLYLVGGSGGSDEVWRSEDGNDWTPLTEEAEFKAVNDHQVVTFDDGHGEAIWLVGGDQLGLGGIHNEVWRSKDGEHWRQGIKGGFSLADADD